MLTRTIFMGSPEFALPTLQALDEHYPVVGVVTQPDRPAGRGRTLSPPPVKALAVELGLPVIQPNSLREPEALEQLRNWEPELIVVAAFGQILRKEVLDLPPFGSINVHASLLPRWRGAAPIQAAILQGDQETGITIMKMDPGVDTGPILSQRAIPIPGEATVGSLSLELAQLGADLLIETLPGYLHGELKPKPQEGEANYAPMIKKADAELDLRRTGEDLERKVRAYNPWPGAFLSWKGGRLKVHRARFLRQDLPGELGSQKPGDLTSAEAYPAIVTSDGLLILEEVQPAGKKPMPGEVFLRGARYWES
jgi:methionyl-tRNA formyltransferase